MSNDDSLEIEEARGKLEQYASTQRTILILTVRITIDDGSTDRATSVRIDVDYNGNAYRFDSIQEKDTDDVYRYLDSQLLVRSQFAKGQTLTHEATTNRVKLLAERYENKNSPLYLYSAFIVRDKQTDEFLGVATLGRSSWPAAAEMSRLNRSQAWSQPRGSDRTLSKSYAGLGTMETMTLLHYAEYLKSHGHLIDGKPLERVVASSRIDNEASWKSSVKAGMTLDRIEVRSIYDRNLRYHFVKQL
jgi:hypothetical protein